MNTTLKALDILKNFTIIKDEWEPICADRSYDRRTCLKNTCGYDNFLNDLVATMAQDCGGPNDISLSGKIEHDLLNTLEEKRRPRAITQVRVMKAVEETIRGIVRHVIIKSDAGSMEIAIVYPKGNFLPWAFDRYNYYYSNDGTANRDPSAIYVKPQIYCQLVDGSTASLNTSYYQEDYAGKNNVGYFLPLAWPSATGEHFYHFRPSDCAFDPVEIDNSIEAPITEQLEKHILRSVIYALGERGIITIATNGAALAEQLKGTSLINNKPFNKTWSEITIDCINYLRKKQAIINATIDRVCGGK